MPADTANESRIHAVSWHETHRDAVDLAARVAALGDWQGLIAVSRGGLVPAAVLSRALGLRVVETLCIASYDGQTKGSVTVLKNAGPAVGDGAGWLMIDDLVDSGATAAAARRLFPTAVAATTAFAAAVQHGQFAAKALQHHLRRVALLTVVALPLAGLQGPFNVDLGALAQEPLGDIGEPLVEDDHTMPFRAFALFARCPVAPSLGRRQRQVDHLRSVLGRPHLRITSEVADQDHLVHRTSHRFAAFVSLLHVLMNAKSSVHADPDQR